VVTMQKWFVGLTVSAALLLAAVAYGQMGMMRGRGGMGMSSIRHQFVMQNGINPKYADRRNPLRVSAANLKEGKMLYERNCAACHGPTGLGDGPAAASLNPPPPDIAASAKMPMATDGYLYWTIADGGAPLGTPMPAFKNTLAEDQIWRIVAYLREL
jgi:mono/diheme cytochrome c family protein